jgi:hypothetical protein
MTELHESPTKGSVVSDGESDAAEEAGLGTLLRGVLDAGTAEAPDLLGGVQRKLRERSGGKFYTDGWSTTRHAPISTYLVTSLLILAFVTLVYGVIHPLSGNPQPVRNVPEPIEVLPR